MAHVSLSAMDTKQLAKHETVVAEAPLDDRLLIPLSEVCRLVGLGRSQIYAMVQQGTFPRPVRLGRRCSRWRMATVRAWVEGL